MDKDLIHAYIEIIEEQSRLKQRLNELSSMREQLCKELLPQLQDAGVQSLAVAGHGTLYQSRTVRANVSAENRAELAAALKGIGMGDIVLETVNLNTLSAWVREHDPDKMFSEEQIKERLPRGVRELIDVTEVIDLRVKGS